MLRQWIVSEVTGGAARYKRCIISSGPSNCVNMSKSSTDQELRVDAKAKEISEVKRQEEQRLEKLRRAEAELEAVEKELEDLPPFQPKTEEIVSNFDPCSSHSHTVSSITFP